MSDTGASRDADAVWGVGEGSGGADDAAAAALADAGFELDGVPEPLRAEAAGVLAALAELDGPIPAGSAGRSGRVAAAVAAFSSRAADVSVGGVGTDLAAPVAADVSLCEDDRDALDALVMAGFEAERVPASLRLRAHRLEGLGAAVRGSGSGFEAWLAAGRADRVEAAVAAVTGAGPASIPIETRRPRGRLRIGDALATAAIVLLGFSVLLPVVGSLRHSAQQRACLAGLGGAGEAFGLYAGDYGEALPMAAAGFGGSWLSVGEAPDRSNSANLYTLIRSGYSPIEQLACPGNAAAPTAVADPSATDWRSAEEVSYSYQLMWGNAPRRWRASPERVVLADRSPVVLRVLRREPIVPEANSPNHRGEGQHVLMLAGGARWVRSPVVSSAEGAADNIWLPRAVEAVIRDARIRVGVLDGDASELPASPDDVFLGP